MKSLRLVLMVWWFLMASKGGSFAPAIFMVIGPFDTSETCKRVGAAMEATGKGELIDDCWEGSR